MGWAGNQGKGKGSGWYCEHCPTEHFPHEFALPRMLRSTPFHRERKMNMGDGKRQGLERKGIPRTKKKM
eukprot:6138506-Heterocapsa_arctica.AAC.1